MDKREIGVVIGVVSILAAGVSLAPLFDLSIGLLLGISVGGVMGISIGMWVGRKAHHNPQLEVELHQAREALAVIRLNRSRSRPQLICHIASVPTTPTLKTMDGRTVARAMP
ncbi:hypothetical protein BOW53_13000 [Solemya pervernicosa gill symbiont]|uniref:Uncharacterized protein n=2 Tax=Gammaproteobacteria incertae sedis TaxID=118884 RepID=A0A1T2L241_9GAMM|nr:hypothetical protein [Candidatus Reidiella endopervernicosa]OOZ39090.1 hypothetical protein BOW53_13000 [Solemya pervernicosa gill symbiont]QKQ27187.1 hypothetical protein HUE57_13475 [Candidatus Reidiella endopervernicosa]